MSIFSFMADQLAKIPNIARKREAERVVVKVGRYQSATHQSLANELAKHKNGLTAIALARIFKRDPRSVRETLAKERGVYVSQWVKNKSTRGQFQAVWMAGNDTSVPKPTRGNK